MSTGWEISVYRQANNPEKPAAPSSQRGDRMAIWQAWSNGLEWLDRLVRESRAVHVGDDGFSTHWYSMPAATLLLHLANGDSALLPLSLKHGMTVNHDVAAQCEAAEWLLLEAVDIS